MNGIISHTLISDDLTTTSLIVAEAFGKRHDDVLKRIRALETQSDFYARNFAETEITRPSPLNGAPIKSKAYRITRDGFALLVMGFTGAKAMGWKIRFLEAFNAMETALRTPQVTQVKAHTRRLPNPAPALPPAPETTPEGLLRAAEARREAIRKHADALMALIRAEVAPGHTSLRVDLTCDWGPDPRLNTNLSLAAQSCRTFWKPDARFQDGGMFVSGDVEHWEPGRRGAA